MSPAKSPNPSQENALTIEFSGISTLVWNKKAGTAEVYLVDLASAGFDKHFAGLGLEVSESTPRGIKGPNADAAISVSGENKDIGIWNLLGTTVEIIGATGKLAVDNSKVNPTEKPDKNAQSILWMANVSRLTESQKLDPVCPTAAVIKIPAGRITAAGAEGARKIEFLNNGAPVEPDRFCVPRFKVVIPFANELAVRLSRDRVLRFSESMQVMISNTCVCGLGVGPAANHFYGHYDVVQAKRRPTAKPAGRQRMMPWYPEICMPGFVEV